VAFSRRVRFLFYGAAGVVAALGIASAVVIYRFQPVARDYVMAALRERYNSGVELGDLQISLFPSVHAVGQNLVLRFGGRNDLPPMVRVRQFTLDADFVSFFRNPKRIALLRLDGLEIHMPPRSAGGNSSPSSGEHGKPVASFLLDEVVADSAVVSTTPSDPGKDPLVFQIHELKMHSVGMGRPMSFHARLENPKPPGLIDTTGDFGPWNAIQPRDTPVSGQYTFRGADLSVFKGISGILSSDGKYKGPLDRLEVQGTTDVPDFALDIAHQPVPLHTEFEATVDGTNGDTVLHPVKARLGSSNFEVGGSVARGALEKNREIVLEANEPSGLLTDFLRLTVKGTKPPMTGRIGFKTKIIIPPGPASVVDRIELDGRFTLSGVKFTSSDVQDKIAGLSHRAQGQPENHDPNVLADFRGNFHLRDGVLGLPDLTFTLPGAQVGLAGRYGLRSGSLDFKGTAKLDATVSQMTTGVKRLLLKPLDRFFSRDGAGVVLPIRISGTRGEPSFTLDIGQMFKRH